MKIRRSVLFRFSIFLLSLVLVINPLNVGSFLGEKANAQSSGRPYVVFVNGYQDCCTWGRYTNRSPDPSMDIVVGALPPNSEIRYVPWDRFENGANQRGSTSNDAEFLRQAAEFINQLDPNRPLILIGHSFGGDSLLSLAPRINRRIQFLGVIDPTAAGGLREPVTRRGVPSNVDYFFNRWQRNALDNVDIAGLRERFRIGGGSARNVVPFDSRLVGGSISGCSAGTCDELEQSSARRKDGSEIRVSCEAHEVSCEGWRLPGCNFSGCWRGSNGTKAKGLFHNDMPLDEYLQRQMADRISSVLASFRPPKSPPISSVGQSQIVGLSNKCIGVRNGNSESGTPLILWECNGNADQRWSLTSQGYLQGLAGKCIGVQNGNSESGTPLILWECNGNADQRWSLASQGYLQGLAGKCIGVQNGNSESGTPLILWECNGNADQRWSISP